MHSARYTARFKLASARPWRSWGLFSEFISSGLYARGATSPCRAYTIVCRCLSLRTERSCETRELAATAHVEANESGALSGGGYSWGWIRRARK